MTGDLTLVADSAITIDGNITMPANAAATLTIVSLNGSINITSNSTIGGGKSTAGVSGNNGGAAQGAGYIRIAAPKGAIQVNGTINGQDGNTGGNGSWINTNWLWTGNATVAGGDGGKGGDVHLCALDSILIKGKITGGAGGTAGSAAATSKKGTATANAGKGGDGGNVSFSSPNPKGNTLLQIAAGGTVTAGAGNDGNTATATGKVDPSPAVANGGVGGDGGTVSFAPSIVAGVQGTVTAGNGGSGKNAVATATAGTNGRNPTPGSNATATGGNGGKAGATPSWIDATTGGLIKGVAGTPGGGGDATANAGNGGDATAGGAIGAISGTGTAQGGTNGVPAAMPAPVVTGPTTSAVPTGGVASPAVEAGIP